MPLVSFLRALRACSAALLCLVVAAIAQAAAPAPPQVTAGADTKQLQFDWEIVPRSNYYEFWYKSDDGAPWVKFSELRPWQTHAVNNVAAHLFNWDQAQYMVTACNPGGCVFSAPVPVHDRMFETMGYFKPSGSYQGAGFGRHAAISEDGQTIAAIANGEPVPGGYVSTLYIFAKVNGSWQQQRRIVPSTTMPDRHNLGRGGTVALSGDGNRLVSSVSVCTSGRTACYQMLSAWVRSGSTWTREYQVVGDTPFNVGNPVQINEAGNRILNDVSDKFEMFERTANGWIKRAPLPPAPAGNLYCSGRLSGDGETFARACQSGTGIRLLIAKAPDWTNTRDQALPVPPSYLAEGVSIDYAGTTIALATVTGDPPEDDEADERRPQVLVLKIASGTLSTTILRPESWALDEGGRFGRRLALSRDGGLLAVWDVTDQAAGRGVLSPPLQRSTVTTTGATNIYELRPAGPRLRRVIKPNNLVPRYHGAEEWVAFANNGKSLLVTDSEDASNATGINGDRDDRSRPAAGALWLY